MSHTHTNTNLRDQRIQHRCCGTKVSAGESWRARVCVVKLFAWSVAQAVRANCIHIIWHECTRTQVWSLYLDKWAQVNARSHTCLRFALIVRAALQEPYVQVTCAKTYAHTQTRAAPHPSAGRPVCSHAYAEYRYSRRRRWRRQQRHRAIRCDASRHGECSPATDFSKRKRCQMSWGCHH